VGSALALGEPLLLTDRHRSPRPESPGIAPGLFLFDSPCGHFAIHSIFTKETKTDVIVKRSGTERLDPVN
jgi:hypothetical protein